MVRQPPARRRAGKSAAAPASLIARRDRFRELGGRRRRPPLPPRGRRRRGRQRRGRPGGRRSPSFEGYPREVLRGDKPPHPAVLLAAGQEVAGIQAERLGGSLTGVVVGEEEAQTEAEACRGTGA